MHIMHLQVMIKFAKSALQLCTLRGTQLGISSSKGHRRLKWVQAATMVLTCNARHMGGPRCFRHC